MQGDTNKIGPLPNDKADNKYVLLDVNYFTKWIETNFHVLFKDTNVRTFIWKKTSFVDSENDSSRQ